MTASDSNIDTIVAVATPAGRGGIGVVRLSGPDALDIAAKLVRTTAPLDHAQARFARVLDPTDPAAPPIDEALVTAFHAPHSYTGETVVEIAAHGSPVVLETIVRASLSQGARLAGPGEFTQRAFLAGRLDLTQAEAVGDLIAAQTLEAARVAAQQLGGALSRRVTPVKAALVHLIALLEAGMDFASGELDDVDVVAPSEIARRIATMQTPLAELAASFRHTQLLRNGASLALIGLPNAGKSSLFNRLLERDRAIVTATAGTTRDTVEETFSIGGIPIRLIDTAGLREIPAATEYQAKTVSVPAVVYADESPLFDASQMEAHRPATNPAGDVTSPYLDEAEALGIARSREALADADVVLLVHDATAPMNEEEMTVLESLSGRPHLVLLNKADLLPENRPDAETAEFTAQHAPSARATFMALSARTGNGLNHLREAILRVLNVEIHGAGNGAIGNLRQREALDNALASIEAAAYANAAGLPHELLLMDLHSALSSLDSLTGTTTTDDILAEIFSTFCIGK